MIQITSQVGTDCEVFNSYTYYSMTAVDNYMIQCQGFSESHGEFQLNDGNVYKAMTRVQALREGVQNLTSKGINVLIPSNYMDCYFLMEEGEYRWQGGEMNINDSECYVNDGVNEIYIRLHPLPY